MKASLHIVLTSSSAEKSFSASPLSGFISFLKLALLRLDSDESKNESNFIGKLSLTLRATR
jgi:hypothetical protein